MGANSPQSNTRLVFGNSSQPGLPQWPSSGRGIMRTRFSCTTEKWPSPVRASPQCLHSGTGKKSWGSRGDAEQNQPLGWVKARAKGQLSENLVECYHDAVLLVSHPQHFRVANPRRVPSHPHHVVPIPAESFNSCSRKVLVGEDFQSVGPNG
jgi:hypothetical protein